MTLEKAMGDLSPFHAPTASGASRDPGFSEPETEIARVSKNSNKGNSLGGKFPAASLVIEKTIGDLSHLHAPQNARTTADVMFSQTESEIAQAANKGKKNNRTLPKDSKSLSLPSKIQPGRIHLNEQPAHSYNKKHTAIGGYGVYKKPSTLKEYLDKFTGNTLLNRKFRLNVVMLSFLNSKGETELFVSNRQISIQLAQSTILAENPSLFFMAAESVTFEIKLNSDGRIKDLGKVMSVERLSSAETERGPLPKELHKINEGLLRENLKRTSANLLSAKFK